MKLKVKVVISKVPLLKVKWSCKGYKREINESPGHNYLPILRIL